MKNFLVYAAIGLGFIAYNVATEANRDESGALVEEGSLKALTIRLGDCFDNAGAFENDEAGDVSSLPGVPCADPHDNEVYAVFDVEYANFPGDEQIAEDAFGACHDRFEEFVGLEYESSTLEIAALYPSIESWAMHNDREVVCAVYDMNGSKLTGTMQGASI